MRPDLHVTFVGLPNVGKSLIFSLATGQHSEVSPYPFSTAKPIHAVIDYIDPRMALLASVVGPSKLYPSRLQFTDVGGLGDDLPQVERGIREALEWIRSADVLAHVLRAFEDSLAPYAFPNVDIERDLQAILTRLCASDSDLVGPRIVQLRRLVRGRKEQVLQWELDLLTKIAPKLESGRPLVGSEWNERELRTFDSLKLITHKPQFYIINYGEDRIPQVGIETTWQPKLPFNGDNALMICGKLESEITELEPKDRHEFLELYPGLELASDRIPDLAISASGRIVYFTFGRLGLKQWCVRRGTTAISAAKRLHTDFADRFIAVEVMEAKDILEVRSVAALNNEGKVRLQGREYVVQDGDILYFRFRR